MEQIKSIAALIFSNSIIFYSSEICDSVKISKVQNNDRYDRFRHGNEFESRLEHVVMQFDDVNVMNVWKKLICKFLEKYKKRDFCD